MSDLSTDNMLPSGTVTFLFTDIEGSTRLWQDHPNEMKEALARHDQLVVGAVEGTGGFVVKGTGDGFFAAFSSAHDAVQAAIQAVSAIRSERWPEAVNIKIRGALHTGDAEERAGDYFGSAANRAARLMSAAHGDQLLLSGTTRDIVESTLGNDIDLKDLGVHRLKDLERPERVYQVMATGLTTDTWTLRTVDSYPNNLPTQLTTFIGRHAEIGDVRERLASARLVTITGVGGAGKTRLGLQVAAEGLEDFGDGVYFVELASISDEALVEAQVAEPFGVIDSEAGSTRSLVDILAAEIRDGQVLLVVDNCEHVLSAVISIADSLLRNCPNLKILATSREVLLLPGESVYALPPLGLGDALAVDPSEFESVQLFVERAAAVRPGFVLTEEDTVVVADLVRHLDGLPLAIELAASRSNVLSPEEILARLGDRFELLASRRTQDQRHETLWAAMDWSYDLLDPDEQYALDRLSVFADGWTLEAAATVLERDHIETINTLDHLATKSLVDVGAAGSKTRYRLLKTVRQYAVEKLATTGDTARAKKRLTIYLVDVAKATARGMKGPDQPTWTMTMDAEHDNVREALAWTLEAGESDLALDLVGSMGWFWFVMGHWREAFRWLDLVWNATTEADELLRARAFYKVGRIEFIRNRPGQLAQHLDHAHQTMLASGDLRGLGWTSSLLAIQLVRKGDHPAGIEAMRLSLDSFRELPDEWGIAYAEFGLGEMMAYEKPSPEAEKLMELGIERFEAIGDLWSAGYHSFGLGQALINREELEKARLALQQSIEFAGQVSDRWIRPHAATRLGIVMYRSGDSKAATVLWKEALPGLQRLGDDNCVALTNLNRGEMESELGDLESARASLLVALDTYRSMKAWFGLAPTARRLGWLAVETGRPELGLKLIGGSQAIEAAKGLTINPYDERRQSQVESDARSALGDDSSSAALSVGRDMTLDAVLDLAAIAVRG